jgi:hypothetical protein
MYTSILLVALTGVAPSAEGTKSVKWSLDYTAAGKQAAQEKKPLAVFLAPGQGSYQAIGRDGGLGSEAEELLARQYVCVHIDTATSQGKALAQAFDVPEGLGIVISDRTGEKQTFRHEGDLARADLVRYLTRYGDPNYVFVETESNPGRAHGGAVAYCGGGCGAVSCGTCGGGCGGHARHGLGGHRGGCGGGHRGGCGGRGCR